MTQKKQPDKEITPASEVSISKKLLRPDEAADILNVSRYTIYRMLKSGKIEGTKVGGGVRVFGSSLEEYISKNRIK